MKTLLIAVAILILVLGVYLSYRVFRLKHPNAPPWTFILED